MTTAERIEVLERQSAEHDERIATLEAALRIQFQTLEAAAEGIANGATLTIADVASLGWLGGPKSIALRSLVEQAQARREPWRAAAQQSRIIPAVTPPEKKHAVTRVPSPCMSASVNGEEVPMFVPTGKRAKDQET